MRWKLTDTDTQEQMAAMKITKLYLANYRDARALSIELNPKLNVFVGVNGSGKSTVPDAIAIMLMEKVRA